MAMIKSDPNVAKYSLMVLVVIIPHCHLYFAPGGILQYNKLHTYLGW